MSKYIELEKAIEAVKGAFKFEVESPANYRDIAVETLKLLPSADVVKRVYRGRRPSDDLVEVVRCKECKHNIQGYCEYWGDRFHYWEECDLIDEDGFCHKGEKE